MWLALLRRLPLLSLMPTCSLSPSKDSAQVTQPPSCPIPYIAMHMLYLPPATCTSFFLPFPDPLPFLIFRNHNQFSNQSDERMVVQVLCSRTKAQLEAIDQAYRRKYSKTLKEYCEAEMGGNLSQFLAFTQMSEAEFDSYVLMDAFSGIGCDKAVVVEVLVTRSFDRIRAAR
jgi:hypothetical protein